MKNRRTRKRPARKRWLMEEGRGAVYFPGGLCCFTVPVPVSTG